MITTENRFMVRWKRYKTPYHYDLTNNLFIQIYGQKEFTLISPDQTNYMYNNIHVYSDIPSFDYTNDELNKYPDFNNVKLIKFIINPGDILFIPIGWYHKVKGLSDTISLSLVNFKAKNNFFNDYPNN